MNTQRKSNTVVGYFRSDRKCFSFNGSLLFLLVFIVGIVHQAATRPNKEEELFRDFYADDEFKDVDNLEIHHVKMVNGVAQEDHPIIIYKEDFVSDDYVPLKNETHSGKHKRRNKDNAHRRRHRQNITDLVIEEKPQNILFDIIPKTPLIRPEDMVKHRRSHIKLVPLDELNKTKEFDEEKPSKNKLHKRPKKYHSRVRRDVNTQHIVRKRNPYFRHVPKTAGEVPAQVQYIYVKHSVPGKKHNGLDILVPRRTSPAPTSGPDIPISIGNRVAADENDRVIFSSGKTTKRPTSKPTESIFRDPRPENFDFSFMSNHRQTTTAPLSPIYTRRPDISIPLTESIFRDPRPENFDFGFMNRGQQNTGKRLATSGLQRDKTGISQCVWAIVNCCSSRSSEIRYSCFEQNGCHGAFWGLNPCADNVRDNFINYVAEYYN